MSETSLAADILIVDDEPQNLRLLVQLLTHYHYHIRAVNSGQQALQVARLAPPAIILLDIMMPEMDGYETCRQLKSDPLTQDIPVIFLSALDNTQDKVTAFQAGGVDYITKPFQVEEALVRINTHLQLRETQRQLQAKNAQLEREIAERQRIEAQMQLLRELDMAVLGVPTPESIAAIAAIRLRQILNCQRVTVLEFRADNTPRILVVEAGGSFDVRSRLGESYTPLDIQMFSRRHVIPDLGELASRTPLQERLYAAGTRAFASVPLPFKQNLIGALQLEADRPHAFTAEHIELITQVAISLAIGLHQARLSLDLQQEISERKQAQMALQEHARELEASNAELDAFAHTVAHDLKNPLTSLLGFAQLLQEYGENWPPEKIHRSLEWIIKSGEKITSIVNALLLLADVRKSASVPMTELDMGAIVAEVQARLETLFANTGATLILPATWPVAMGHALWVEEVWANYLSNAAKYGGRPDENVPPQIRVGCDAPVNGMVRCWVQDNGPGIPLEQQTQLFTQFTRLHQTKVEGYGLGLSIVQRIVTRLGGQVGVESQPGQGSCFYFTLPAALAEMNSRG